MRNKFQNKKIHRLDQEWLKSKNYQILSLVFGLFWKNVCGEAKFFTRGYRLLRLLSSATALAILCTKNNFNLLELPLVCWCTYSILSYFYNLLNRYNYDNFRDQGETYHV